MMSLGLLAVAVLLALAVVPVLLRIINGPTMLDRAVAADMLAVIAVMALAVEAARTRSALPGAAMLAITAFAFLGTIAIARFVGRADSGTSQAAAHRAEPYASADRSDVAATGSSSAPAEPSTPPAERGTAAGSPVDDPRCERAAERGEGEPRG